MSFGPRSRMHGDGLIPNPPAAIPSRMKALPVFLGFIVFAVLLLLLTLPGLFAFLHELLQHLPLVALAPREAVGPPLALLALALAGITLSNPSVSGKDRARTIQQPKTRRITWTGFCLAVAFGAVLITVAAIPVVEITASMTMTARGYLRCPSPSNERRAPMRWVLPAGHCDLIP